jgi:chromosome segregation ATPase
MASRLDRRWVSILVSFALVSGLVMLSPLVSDAAPASSNPRQLQQDVRKRKADAAAQVDALRASDGEVTQALSDLNSNVAGAQAEMNDAQRAVGDASERADQFDALASETQGRIDHLRKQVAEASVEAYMRPPVD